jgi:hypothetical protein
MKGVTFAWEAELGKATSNNGDEYLTFFMRLIKPRLRKSVVMAKVELRINPADGSAPHSSGL